MKTPVAELTLTAAQTVLLNVKAGRIYDPLTVQWARDVVDANGVVSERLERLLGACPWGVFVVNEALLSDEGLRDICRMTPGIIIRATSIDAVRFIPSGDNPMLDCIAGWISDDDFASGSPYELPLGNSPARAHFSGAK